MKLGGHACEIFSLSDADSFKTRCLRATPNTHDTHDTRDTHDTHDT
jgi:hypothetical protein